MWLTYLCGSDYSGILSRKFVHFNWEDGQVGDGLSRDNSSSLVHFQLLSCTFVSFCNFCTAFVRFGTSYDCTLSDTRGWRGASPIIPPQMAYWVYCILLYIYFTGEITNTLKCVFITFRHKEKKNLSQDFTGL